MLEAVKVWPSKAEACRKVGATANLDSFCTRLRERNHVTVIPTAPNGAIVLEAVKVWPSKAEACRKVGTTANLDSFCTRRRERNHGRDEEIDFQIEQRN